MGTINYKTSDFITLGYNCNNINHDDEFYNDDISFLYDDIATARARYYFYYFCVTIEPGYYEGYSINIEHNYSYCYDSYSDKREAMKEITRIKKFLLECINNYECVAVSPGWCTSYADYKTTLMKLNAAIKEMRETVKNTPTWAMLPIGERFA